jgi:hypothetical protein
LQSSWMSKTYLKSDHFNGGGSEPYRQTVERLLADRGVDHVACLLAYALRDLDKAQGKA